MKIVVVGTGYVGLVTGACFAEVGVHTICVDIDINKIENLKKGILPIYEQGLEEIVVNNLQKGRLEFSNNLGASIKDCDVIFIAVGTPPDEDGSADLRHVVSVASEIGNHIEKYAVIVTKSTVPVGTSKKVKETIKNALDKRNVAIEFDVASNPEFLKEGAAVNDFMRPERIIIGVETQRAEDAMKSLYKPFLLNGHPCIFMDIPSAEMTKYAANSMLATKISFMNDIANLCDILGVDVNMVRKGIGSDSRIGDKFIYPGAGYGGSCFPKDVKALIRTANENGYEMKVLQAVEKVNDKQKEILFSKLNKYFKDLKGKKIALWGLAFKPNTDDMREAPSLVLIDQLLNAGASVQAYDPKSIHEAQRILGEKITFYSEQYKVLEGADALVILTEWSEFRLPDFDKISKILKNKVIFDGRNIYDPNEMVERGYYYECIGRNKK
jgi:UDPglucose 6-dehydrogenase